MARKASRSAAVILCTVIWAALITGGGLTAPLESQYVVHISVDGLRSDVIEFLGPEYLPNLYRMRISGISTDNARTDYDYTNTLPNHSCMLTARPVLGDDGHGVSFNTDPGTTFEIVKGYYIAGVFDRFHDNGHSTAMYASKSKFAFFERSWDSVNGAPDTTGDDNGRDKLDIYLNLGDTYALVDSFLAHTADQPSSYSFVHLYDPDGVGHDYGWESTEYYQAVMKIDMLLGRIFALIDDTPMAGVTTVIVTADHGGTGTSHDNPALAENYTIPVYLSGPGVPAGMDLYAFNPASRRDPIDQRPSYEVSPPPVRNGGTANIALELLGLGPIPGSVINAGQDLDVVMPNGSGDLPGIEITSPTDGILLDFPATVDIEATVGGGGAVSRVEFYGDWVLLGQDETKPYTWAWEHATPGEHVIAARVVREDGIASVDHVDIELSSVTEADDMVQEEIVRVFPHPVRGRSKVLFSLSAPGYVEMDLYDTLGRRVDRVIGSYWSQGTHSAELDSRGLAPGFYFYKLAAGMHISSGKILVLR